MALRLYLQLQPLDLLKLRLKCASAVLQVRNRVLSFL